MPRLAQSRGTPSTAELGRRIRAERERLGISQAEAARRLGIARGSYRQMEQATVLQAGVLVGLVRDLGMDPKAILPEVFRPGS